MRRIKVKSFMYLFMFFILFSLNVKNTHAKEVFLPETANLGEIFGYEYEGQTLEYTITGLANDTVTGEVSVAGVKDKTLLTGEVVIPATVTYLGTTYKVSNLNQYAFQSHQLITSVTIPEGIKVIPIGAFDECINLQRVVIPNALTTIGVAAFRNCKKLQEIELLDTVTNISANSFQYSYPVFTVMKGSYAAEYCKVNALQLKYIEDGLNTEIPIEDVVLQKSLLKMYIQEKHTLLYLTYPMNASREQTATWSSSNQKVATVDSNGVVTAVGEGAATITVNLGGSSVECMVTVNPYAPRSVKAVSTGIDSIKITWQRVRGAKGYSIYRASSKTGKYVRVKYVSTPYFIDTNLKYKTSYYYKVIAYTSGSDYFVYSRPSTIVGTQTKIAKPVVTASSTKYDNIKLRWDNIRGAAGYYVYRSTTKYGTYKYFKNVSGNYHIDSLVTKGKTYYYKVKAYHYWYGKKVYSQSSYAKSALAKTPATPKIVSIGTSKSDVYKILGRPFETNYYGSYLELYYRKDLMSSSLEYGIIDLQKIDNEYVVIGWYNRYSGLKLSDGNESNTGTFTLGSSIKEVAKAMESPIWHELDFAGVLDYAGTSNDVYLSNNYLEYRDGSIITFDEEKKVVGWVNEGSLKVKYGAAKPTNAVITLGTSLAEVLSSAGTADALQLNSAKQVEYLIYGDTMLYFDHYQELVAWENKNKMNIVIGNKDLMAPKIKVGSTVDEVIKSLGTPDSYIIDNNLEKLQAMVYGNTIVGIDANRSVYRIQY